MKITITQKAEHYEKKAEEWRDYAFELEEKLKDAATALKNIADDAATTDAPQGWPHASRVKWQASNLLKRWATMFYSKKPRGNLHL